MVYLKMFLENISMYFRKYICIRTSRNTCFHQSLRKTTVHALWMGWPYNEIYEIPPLF